MRAWGGSPESVGLISEPETGWIGPNEGRFSLVESHPGESEHLEPLDENRFSVRGSHLAHLYLIKPSCTTQPCSSFSCTNGWLSCTSAVWDGDAGILVVLSNQVQSESGQCGDGVSGGDCVRDRLSFSMG